MGISDSMTHGMVTAVFVLLAVKVSLVIHNIRKFNRKFKDFPQWPSHPLLGHLDKYPGPNDAGLSYHRKKVAEFPLFSLSWLGLMPFVHVTHPDTVKIILKSSEPKANAMYRFLHPWLGQGLLTSNGNRWARSRRLLTPAFHFDILKGYIPMKNDLCKDLLVKFERAAKSGECLNVFDCISMFTLDVILQSTMSYETGCQKDGKKHPYIIAVNEILRTITNRMMKPWVHPNLTFYLTPSGWRFYLNCRFVHQVADNIISRRQKELEFGKIPNKENSSLEVEKKRSRQDFLDTLITARDEDGKGLTNKEIRDEVDTFLFEGHDTTASAISWCLYSLAEHPHIQKRVQAELDSVFEDREDDSVLWEDLPKLQYLTMALKEAMRLHAPVPANMRELTKDIEIDGYTIPKETNITINTYCVHHNPTVWEDTLKYDPERFSPENTQTRDPFAFIPFSAGPRNCIGQSFAMEEMKIALARILRRYEIKLDEVHEVKKFRSLVMKAETDIKLSVKSRLAQS